MDDFTALARNVRQISQYPYWPIADPGDSILLQVGGLGGPYVYTRPNGLAKAILGLPSVTDPQLGIVVPRLTTVLGDTQGFNWYRDGFIDRRYRGGVAGRWSFGSGGLAFAVAPAGVQDAPISGHYWREHLRLRTDGHLSGPQQLALRRGPIAGDEVVTLDYLLCNAATSFNGRVGAIELSAADLSGVMQHQVTKALTPEDPDTCTDQVATTAFVQCAVTTRIQDLMMGQAFVYTFNGRCGDIEFTADDATRAFLADNARPQTSDPRMGDYSHRIPNTRWVTWMLDELESNLEDRIQAASETTINYIIGGYAPLHDAVLTGVPTAPTAPPGSATGQLATTAFVMAAVAESVAGVATWNGRAGNVVLTQQDIIDANGWTSPNLSGIPLAPTAVVGTQTNQIATTAFVMQQMEAIDAGVVSFNNRSGVVSLAIADITGAGGAPLASPNFSGTPTAPTAAPGTNTQQLATCAFVMANIGVATFNGRAGAVTLNTNDISAAGGALLASPAFTNVPTAPTAAPGTSTTQLATTAFVQAAVAANAGVTSFNTRAGAITLTGNDVDTAGALMKAGGTITGALTVNAGLTTAPSSTATINGDINVGGLASFYGDSRFLGPVHGNPATNVISFDGTLGSVSGTLNISALSTIITGNMLLQGLPYTPGGGPWNDSSDQRIKTVHEPYAHGLAEIERLEPVIYSFKGNDQFDLDQPSPHSAVVDKRYIGLVAQDVELVMPEMVEKTDGYIDGHQINDLRKLNTAPLAFAIVNAIKELAERIKVLEDDHDTLSTVASPPRRKSRKRS